MKSLLSKSSLLKMFSAPTLKRKFLEFEERFRKAPTSVGDSSGVVWTDGHNRGIKLRFQISPAHCASMGSKKWTKDYNSCKAIVPLTSFAKFSLPSWFV